MTNFFDTLDESAWSDEETESDQPLTLDQAVQTVIGFGKNKGKTIGELVRSSKGRSYLNWCVSNFENMFESTRAAMVLVLSEYEKAKAKRT
jgi:hypothetical protein